MQVYIGIDWSSEQHDVIFTNAAGAVIQKLTIQYNRSRQAAITTELIEIIAGAEAL